MYLRDGSRDAIPEGTAVQVAELLRAGAAQLQAAGVADPHREVDWLLGDALGVGRGQLHLDSAAAVVLPAQHRFRDWCARRAQREPLQYILGTQPFWTCQLRVDPRVLIPRQETERIVEFCLTLHRGGAIADIGTGSGAIAIALALERPGERVIATDVSAQALQVARENAHANGVQRISWVCGDLLEPLSLSLGACALIVCNPPYVATGELQRLAPEVRDWEPRVALDGGADGLDYYRRMAPSAARAMRPGAWIVVEIGAGQRAAVESLFAGTRAFDAAVPMRDYGGIERGIGFRRGHSSRAGWRAQRAG